MKHLLGTESVAYRALAFASNGAWITVLWLVTSLPLLTAVMSATGLHDAAAALSRGERYGCREFGRALWHARRDGLAWGAVLVAAWAACIAALTGVGAAPLAAGALLVVVVMLIIVTSVAPLAILSGRTGLGAGRAMLLMVSSRPGRCTLVGLLWIGVAAGVIFMPFQFAVLVVLLAPMAVATVAVRLLVAPDRGPASSAVALHTTASATPTGPR
ncbi:MAG: hypothetical protein QM675_11890 [Protaetiibacter sp.]